MENVELRVFTKEINKQCEFSLYSVEGIEDSLNNLRNQDANSRLWFFVQSFLVSTSNVSKLLWGINVDIAESRKNLRETLNVKDDSPLISRTVRNSFEHFDERIQKWASSSITKNFADGNIGPSNMISGIDEKEIFRYFDTERVAITFQGDIFEIKPIVDEIMILREKTKQKLKQFPF